MNSLTAAAIAKLKDDNGSPIWREGLIVGQPATLLGRPVEIDEGMPAPTAGNTCIAFGDFKAGYLINDRLGTRVLRDPYTNKPFVMFYATKRVGAGVTDPHAIRLLKVPA
jgi:HK97 family phage major capsid protein